MRHYELLQSDFVKGRIKGKVNLLKIKQKNILRGTVAFYCKNLYKYTDSVLVIL